MKRTHTSTELPFVVSVRFSESDYRQLLSIADAGRHNLSQTVRLLIENALEERQTGEQST